MIGHQHSISSTGFVLGICLHLSQCFHWCEGIVHREFALASLPKLATRANATFVVEEVVDEVAVGIDEELKVDAMDAKSDSGFTRQNCFLNRPGSQPPGPHHDVDQRATGVVPKLVKFEMREGGNLVERHLVEMLSFCQHFDDRQSCYHVKTRLVSRFKKVRYPVQLRNGTDIPRLDVFLKSRNCVV